MSANLLQIGSKRRRTKAQIEEEKQLKLEKEAMVEEKLADYDVLQQKFDILEQAKSNGDAAASVLEQVINAGFVNQENDGSFVVSGDGSKRKFRAFDNM